MRKPVERIHLRQNKRGRNLLNTAREWWAEQLRKDICGETSAKREWVGLFLKGEDKEVERGMEFSLFW